MSYLVLIRHGESEWNEKGLWTGWTDIGLSRKGEEEAKHAGLLLKDIPFKVAYTSQLIRTKQTLEGIEESLKTTIPKVATQALNERNYGDYTGKNKWEIQKEVGEKKFLDMRRGWDVHIPNGETLKNVYSRVVPYYTTEILPKLEKGENVLVVAHGNSLRALVKYLENITDADIEHLDIATGEIYIYEIDEAGNILHKEIRTAQE